MSSERAFNEERPGTIDGETRGSQGNAEINYISGHIEKLYEQLLEFDFTYDQLYEMTIRELVDTLIARRKGMAYKLWKEAYMISWATMGKNYPKTPEKASPELYPPKPRITMPDNLLKERLKQLGGKTSE